MQSPRLAVNGATSRGYSVHYVVLQGLHIFISSQVREGDEQPSVRCVWQEAPCQSFTDRYTSDRSCDGDIGDPVCDGRGVDINDILRLVKEVNSKYGAGHLGNEECPGEASPCPKVQIKEPFP